MANGERQERRGDRRAHMAAAAFGLAFSLLLASGGSALAQAAEREVFGAAATRSNNLATFPRWTGVLQRYFSGNDPLIRACRGDVFRRCMSEEWKGFLDEIAREDKATQITKVNARMNRARYITDNANYGQPDYWATPGEFFRLDGDCEDYAIAKYLSLRALGFDDESLRILVLEDLNLRVAHAILVVYYNDTPYLLDNQIPQVVAASAIRHYKPIYSLNEKSWWLYRPKPPGAS